MLFNCNVVFFFKMEQFKLPLIKKSILNHNWFGDILWMSFSSMHKLENSSNIDQKIRLKYWFYRQQLDDYYCLESCLGIFFCLISLHIYFFDINESAKRAQRSPPFPSGYQHATLPDPMANSWAELTTSFCATSHWYHYQYLKYGCYLFTRWIW